MTAVTTPTLLNPDIVLPILRLGEPLSMPLADTLPPILRLLSKLLETQYQVEVRTMSISEKNKGGEYHSAGFSFDTALIDRTAQTSSISAQIVDAITRAHFTLHGLSPTAFEPVYTMCAQAFSQIVPHDPHVSVDPHNLTQQAVELRGQSLLVTYTPLTAQLTISIFQLNDWHKTLYHAYVAKWFEHSANPNPVHESVAAHERQNLLSRYELFLCTVLTQYFNLTPVQ